MEAGAVRCGSLRACSEASGASRQVHPGRVKLGRRDWLLQRCLPRMALAVALASLAACAAANRRAASAAEGRDTNRELPWVLARLLGSDGRQVVQERRVPQSSAANEVSAIGGTVAESLLMCMVTLVCFLELRREPASRHDAPLKTRCQWRPSRRQLGAPLLAASPSAVAAAEAKAGTLQWVADEMREPHAKLLLSIMLLQHVALPMVGNSPGLACLRFAVFLGLLWNVGWGRLCQYVPYRRALRWARLALLALLCAAAHLGVCLATAGIIDLVFLEARSISKMFRGPLHIRQLVAFLFTCPDDLLARCGLVAAVLAAAVWREFLFRGVYLGFLRRRLPFWTANASAALIYALALEPPEIAADGTLRLGLVECVLQWMGAMWYGYVYSACDNLMVTVLAHTGLNALLLAMNCYSGSRQIV